MPKRSYTAIRLRVSISLLGMKFTALSGFPSSVTLEIESVQRECGPEIGAFEWGLSELMTIAILDGVETVANPRYLRNQLVELKWLGQDGMQSRKLSALIAPLSWSAMPRGCCPVVFGRVEASLLFVLNVLPQFLR